MTAVGNRIPPELFDRARRLAAEERAKALAVFFAALACKLQALLKPRHQPADVHLRFHRGGLWRGI